MKFIVDAQLPYRLKTWLSDKGFDAVHTADLPQANGTEDLTIADIAESEGRTVVSKDSDFLKLHILSGRPPRLLLITTGNIVNRDLFDLLERNFEIAIKLFATYKVVELNNNFVLGHNP